MWGKFQTKLIVSQIITVICLILLLAGIFYGYIVEDMTKRSLEDFETITQKTVTQFDTLLYNMDKTALQVAANPNIVNIFQKTGRDKGNYFIQEPVVSAEIVKLLNSYNFKRDAFARICLYNDYGDFVSTATTVTTNSGIQRYFASDHFLNTKEHFQENSNYMYYISPEKDLLNDTNLSERRYFSIVREIKDYSSNSSKCGYVEVQEYTDRLETIFGDLGDKNYALVLNGKDDIIYETPSIKSDAASQKTEQAFFRQIIDGTLQFGSASNKEYYYSYKTIGQSPFRILFLKHEGGLTKPLTQFNLVIILAMILSLLLALTVEIVLIKRLSRPLVDLRNSIKKVNINNYTIDMEESKNSDELHQLQEAFNSIFTELKDTMDKHYLSKTNELKSHLFALQSQMNPHFMHNILAIISMEAETTGNEKTQNMCRKLCSMLSFSSSMQDGYCNLEVELNHARDYLDLMQERYEELFEYTIDIDPAVKNQRIPKLIVQPICENCFNHGFKQKEPVWKISISAMVAEDRWLITIKDNGTGFSEEYLQEYQKLMQEVTLENVKDKLEQMKIGGLCIPNIFMRLKICYEDSFICEIKNGKNGAIVTLGGKCKDDQGIGSGR